MTDQQSFEEALAQAAEDFYTMEGQRQRHCPHVGIVSISETECQCMDCLRIWQKTADFVSDWPECDRG